MKMKNTRTLIIGGASGIGLALARLLRSEGGEVTIASRTASRLERAATSLGADRPVETRTVDVGDEDSVRALFEKTGPIDHIVMTTMDSTYQPIVSMDLQGMRRVIDSKLLGALLVAKHGAARLRAGGSLTFTSGIASDRPMPKGSVVAAVNGALNALARALAIELAPLRVNAVSPGWVDTEIWETLVGADRARVQATQAARLPVKRIGRPEEIAEAFLFLLTNGFMTGTVLRIDGGHPLV